MSIIVGKATWPIIKHRQKINECPLHTHGLSFQVFKAWVPSLNIRHGHNFE